MEKLDAREFGKTPLLSKGKCSPFYIAIIGLRKGEVLRISKAEWNLTKTPGRICCHIMKKFPFVKYDYGMMPDSTAWEIMRVE